MLMMDYQEWLGKLQKRGSKPYRLGKCLGARDAFHWVRKNKWKALKGKRVDKCFYAAVIDAVNKEILELILEGHEVEMPHRMGSLMLCCMPAKVAFEDDEWKTNYRTDWLKTLKLWYEDEEARNSHKPIKRIDKDIHYIRYYRSRANYTNKRLYRIRINRSLVKKLGTALNKGRLNAEKRIFNYDNYG